jgi:ABC-type glycerol-3-phosphate transport system substrate-binding protein
VLSKKELKYQEFNRQLTVKIFMEGSMKITCKKYCLLVAALLMLVSGLFAGGQKDDAGKEEKVSLLISRWAGPHADDQKDVVKAYDAGEIIVDDIDYGSLRQKQMTSFQAAAGSGNYDIVWVANQWMKEYVDAGYIMALDDLIQESGLDMSMYAGGLLSGCQFYGKTYGLPTFAQTLILTYDSAAFEAAGLKAPTTSEELVEVAKYFKEKEGTGIAIPAKQGGAIATLFSQFLFSSGGDYLDSNNRIDLTTDEAIYAATLIDRLVEYSVQGVLAWHHDDVADAVRTKKAPIGTVISGLSNQDSDPERSLIVDTVAYAPITGPDGFAAANNAFWVWAVPTNAKDPKASFDGAAWLTGFEAEKQMALKNQQISAINALANDPDVLSAAPFLPVVLKAFANGKTVPLSASFPDFKQALIAALSEIASSDADPAEVMKRLTAEYADVDFSK